MNLIVLHCKHSHVPPIHVAISRAVPTRTQLCVGINPQLKENHMDEYKMSQNKQLYMQYSDVK
jgi:hypothetical protein